MAYSRPGGTEGTEFSNEIQSLPQRGAPTLPLYQFPSPFSPFAAYWAKEPQASVAAGGLCEPGRVGDQPGRCPGVWTESRDGSSFGPYSVPDGKDQVSGAAHSVEGLKGLRICSYELLTTYWLLLMRVRIPAHT